ncbi:nicotinamide/nicotinic acid mononucleotide adenylyltransferase 3 isoform X3 [Glossina fuscipes]|uniref:Nicotinamide-nucleotide adenylyltransferase n=1 Tax=Glossina fuscipes TaxID=7396 RepID=A0A9C5ZL27_9MUSC|nr:nicotinamide/nicotinic acid mononucleotide adenylyltransferase 3 isoform X3 [Glossina fuscipes]
MSAFIEETTNRLLPRIVLIACGSFSPPTPMHLRMFEIAKDHFEVNGTHKVVGGIVSPTHDGYGKKGLAAAKHRCAMIKLALQSSSWIRLSDWETQQDGWSRTKSVLQYHQNFMNNYINSPDVTATMSGYDCLPGWLPANLRVRKDPVQLKLLCGADMLESFGVPGLWSDADIEDIVAHHGLVVVTRSGANPEKFIFDSDVLTKYQRNITLVINWVPNDVSSTVIRRLLARGQSVKYLINDMVIEYIRQNGLFQCKTSSGILCCGDKHSLMNKQLEKTLNKNKPSAPGQAVQVIAAQSSAEFITTSVSPNDEINTKKCKVADV